MSEQGTPRSPLAALGRMPGLPWMWDTMAVVQPTREPPVLAPGERWPITFYRCVGVDDINRALGWNVPSRMAP